MNKACSALAVLVWVVACGGDDEPSNPAGPDAGADPAAVPRIEEAACRFEVPSALGLTQGEDYRCGDLVVREERATEGGATIRLHFIQIDGADSDVATIYLDGGPGGDGNSILGAMADGEEGLSEALLAGGDFLVISQRGTGLSVPALPCDQFNPSAAACSANLANIADLPAYNTAYNADDVDDLRATLGYRQLNLYGISYGSRLTLEILRRHGDNVRAAIAGGTVPAHVVWPAESPANFHAAVGELEASCAADAACQAAYGSELRALVLASIDDLNDDPLIVSAFGQQFPLDGNTYASLLFQLMYSRASYPILPLIITDISERKADRAVDLLLDIFGGSQGLGSMSQGMYYSVVCGELFNPAPAASVFETATAGLPSAVIDAMAPNWAQLSSECAAWPKGRPLPELSAIVTSDVPVLLSNGKMDPITPPRFGSLAKEGLTSAVAVDFANSGHGSTLQSSCGIQVLTDFLAAPDAALDASCAATLTVEYMMPSELRAGALDLARIRRDIHRAPTPPWILERTQNWGPR